MELDCIVTIGGKIIRSGVYRRGSEENLFVTRHEDAAFFVAALNHVRSILAESDTSSQNSRF